MAKVTTTNLWAYGSYIARGSNTTAGAKVCQKALVVTVDTAVPSNREYNIRNGFTIPFRFSWKNILDVVRHPGWMLSVLARYMLTTGMPQYENYPPEMRASITAQPMGKAIKKTDSLTWDDLRQLRAIWPRTLIVKGILDPNDAIAAIDAGADGIIVSNHGGRMLDCSIAPLHALAAWFFATFIVGHVYLTTTGPTPMEGIRAMVTGVEEVEDHA